MSPCTLLKRRRVNNLKDESITYYTNFPHHTNTSTYNKNHQRDQTVENLKNKTNLPDTKMERNSSDVAMLAYEKKRRERN